MVAGHDDGVVFIEQLQTRRSIPMINKLVKPYIEARNIPETNNNITLLPGYFLKSKLQTYYIFMNISDNGNFQCFGFIRLC